MAISLWAARLERPLTERETTAMLRLLPEERRERLAQLRDPEKRREPLCAYLLLCLALREQYGWRSLPDMGRAPSGKPFFPEHPGVHFNLSHTRGAVLVGLGDLPLGVDIERVRPVSPRSMRRIAGAASEQEFFDSWVRREARTKCSGNGISTMMRSEEPLRCGEFYHSLDTFPGYAAGVASRDPASPEKLRRYDLDQLL